MLPKQYTLLLKRDIPTPEENQRLLDKVMLTKSDEDIWNIVHANIRAVAGVLYKYYSWHPEHEILFSSGILGFYLAVKKLKRGVKKGEFVNYVQLYIKGYMQQEIRRLIRTQKRMVSLELISSGAEENTYSNNDSKPIMKDENTDTIKEVNKKENKNTIANFLKEINKTKYKLSPKEIELLQLLYESDDPVFIRNKMGTSKQCIFNWRNKIKSKANRFFKHNSEAFQKLWVTTTLKEINQKNDNK